MSSGSDEIVIRKKRRRTAIDPCLGYYSLNAVDAAPTVADGQLNSAIPPHIADVRNGQGGPQKNISSDSVQAITSPSSADAAIVTVDDFLRQQAMSSTRHCKTTYSSKKKRRAPRRAHFSDDDADPPADANSSDDSDNSIVRPATRKAKPIKTRKSKQAIRKSRKETGLTFSKRMQRAAVLSRVDQDVQDDVLSRTPLPLTLAPFDPRPSPTSPLQNKRARLVDPRFPRQLDFSFSMKENLPTKLKPCQPFSSWDFPSNLGFEASPTVLVKKSATRKPSYSSTLTPLKLVSYEEHDEARSAKFGQKTARRTHRTATPLIFQPLSKVPLPSSSEADEENPFSPLTANKLSVHDDRPLGSASITSRAAVSSDSRGVETCVDDEPMHLCTPVVLAPNTPPSTVQDVLTIHHTEPPANALHNLELAYASSGASDDPLLAPSSAKLERSSSPHHAPQSSQKPMRGLGSFLGSLIETARGVLITQSQSKTQSDGTRDKPSAEPLRKTRRPAGNRKVAVSSPTRHAKRGTGTSQGTIKKALSVSSVSAFLAHESAREDLLTRFASVQRTPPSRDRPEAALAPDSPNFMNKLCLPMDGIERNTSLHFSPTLLDLLNDTDSRNAQVLLSPMS